MSTTSFAWAGMPDPTSSAAPVMTTISQPVAASSDGGKGGGAGLYLYTFLATVIVLVSVSLCILVRGLTLRARRRRHLAAMLAADPNYVPPWEGGPYLAFPHARGREREEVQPPPAMCELRVTGEGEKTAWSDIMPLSATRPSTAPLASSMSESVIAAPASRPRGRLGRYFFPAPPVPDTPAPSVPVISASPTGRSDAYNVAVMIVMPDAARANLKPDDEDAPPPYVEFGLVHIPARGTLSETLDAPASG